MAPKGSNRSIKQKPVEVTAIATPTYPPCILLDLPTELLVKILTHLPIKGLFSVRWTCRTLKDIIASTACLQYIIRAYINGVEDSLPLNFPHSKRLEFLRHHEQSRSNLQFDLCTDYISNMSYPSPIVIQDGYLITEQLRADPQQYRYTDLYSAARNEEVRWVHITMDDGHLPRLYNLTFAVDHNLVVASRFLSFPITFWVQILTNVIANSDLETTRLSRYSLPFLNSRLVHFILSHQRTLCRFHHFMGTAIYLWTWKSWEITSWFFCGVPATVIHFTWYHGRRAP